MENTPTLVVTPPDTEEHNRGLVYETAEILDISYPTSTLARLSAKLLTSGDDKGWQRPNVSFRICLGPEFSEATRIYTVRDFDPATHVLTIDVVIHGETSPMMLWVKTLSPGSQFKLIGPRPHFILPEVGNHKVAIFADETAIPALYSILDNYSGELQGTVWVTARDELVFNELPRLDGLNYEYLPTPADHGHVLAQAAVALEKPEDHVVWAAGERDEMRTIRRHFRQTVGLAKDDVAVFGYWKKGMSNTEIDFHRKANYLTLISECKSMDDIDDLAIDM
jgi:NADPH-dependent ferric siderophore reductase